MSTTSTVPVLITEASFGFQSEHNQVGLAMRGRSDDGKEIRMVLPSDEAVRFLTENKVSNTNLIAGKLAKMEISSAGTGRFVGFYSFG